METNRWEMSANDALLRAVEASPRLCAYGMLDDLFLKWYARSWGREYAFHDCRQRLVCDCLDEFSASVAFLSKCKTVSKPEIDGIGNSYYLKHRAEDWAGIYVSNGALIAASIHIGMKMVTRHGSPNIGLPISKRCPYARGQKASCVPRIIW